MKIRHKQSGVELEGEFVSMGECSGGTARNYFVHASNINGSEYAMTEWEAVEPKWVNVTGECGVKNDNPCMVLTPVGVQVNVNDGYRLRKVGVEWFSGVPLGLAKSGYAFIVEQRQA